MDNLRVKTLEDLGYFLYSDSESVRVYKNSSEEFVANVFINKEMKRVQFDDLIWIPNDENFGLIKMTIPENIRYSSSYGHWQSMHHECSIDELKATLKILEELE